MHTKSLPAILTLLACCLLPNGDAVGQQLQTGEWTGYIVPPNGEKTDVIFDVSTESDSTRISVISQEAGTLPLSNIGVADDRISFEWEPGQLLMCDLKLTEEGFYKGDCLPEDGGDPGMIVMNQPEADEM